MASQAQPRNVRSAASPPGVPGLVLDNLAARFRPGGLFVVLIDSSGTVGYSDAATGQFFHRYALPLLQRGITGTESDFAQWLKKLGTDSTITVYDRLPGIILAAFPFIDRRRHCGFLLLAGKSS